MRHEPVLCSTTLAKRLDAREVGYTPAGIDPRKLAIFRIDAVDRINAAGGLPVFGLDGIVLSWPVLPGARDTGAGF